MALDDDAETSLGIFLSGGPIGYQFWLGLFVFHVLFYGGSTSFNSYYDQDEGPIGGLWNPPRPTRTLLYFSLAIQAIGMILVAWFINVPLLIVALVMFALSTAYSHPAVSLKAHPLASLLTVSVGQGAGDTGRLVARTSDWTPSQLEGARRGVSGFADHHGFNP